MTFSGFPPEGLKFLRSLKRNNKREWFQPRKEIFDTKVKAPMLELIEAVNAELLGFAKDHITDPKKAIYRIYRDTRFSPDKTPYKTHIAAVFPRRDFTRDHGAGYYFQISPESIGIAAGCYMPQPDQLLAIRTWITENHDAFRKAAKGPEKLLGKLGGESLKRSPKGFNPLHPAADLVRMKHWIYWVELDIKLAESPKAVTELIKRFRAAAPVVDMLNKPLTKRPVF